MEGCRQHYHHVLADVRSAVVVAQHRFAALQNNPGCYRSYRSSLDSRELYTEEREAVADCCSMAVLNCIERARDREVVSPQPNQYHDME